MKEERQVKVEVEPTVHFEREVEDLTASLEKLYVGWKRRIIPQYFATFKDKLEIKKTATLVAQKNFDMQKFFNAQIQGADAVSFQAAFLHSKYAENKYNTYQQEMFTAIGVDDLFVQYYKTLDKLIVLGHDPKRVLLDDYHKFPAWFRMVITEQVDNDIAAKYRDRARRELAQDPSIAEFLDSVPRTQGTLPRITNGQHQSI
jgi:hypothetical protein